MKRTWKTVSCLAMAVIFLSAAATGQEKKEQKIKIVVADNNGTKVIIDTLFTGDLPDSVKLSDGNVFYINSGSGDEKDMTGPGKKHKEVFVTYSSDEPSDRKVTKEISVIAGDSAAIAKTGKDHKFIVVSDGKANSQSNYTISTSADADEKNDKNIVYYYVNSGDSKKHGPEKFYMDVRKDLRNGDADKSSYVIAKDGMVITIEGGDEQKVKEISALIEAKLGVNKDKKADKTENKELKKKTDKK